MPPARGDTFKGDTQTMQEAEILVARQGTLCQVRVLGRATFKISQHLREFGVRAIQQGAKQMIFDFSECTALDSTFMGVLAMIGLEGRNKCDVIFINVNPANRKLLDGLGVSKLFRFLTQPLAEVNWNTLACAACQTDNMNQISGTVLDAHQTLMDIDKDNIPKFQSVVEMLRNEVQAAKVPTSASATTKVPPMK